MEPWSRPPDAQTQAQYQAEHWNGPEGSHWLVNEHRYGTAARDAHDGRAQALIALNEVYVGHRGHQSARYRLSLPDGRSKRQSSSGLIAGTGTGATGWPRSAWQERHSQLALPAPEAREVCWFVREAWPSPATGTELTEGLLDDRAGLSVVAETDQLVAFGDGIEQDALTLSWGQHLTVALAGRALSLAA